MCNCTCVEREVYDKVFTSMIVKSRLAAKKNDLTSAA